MKARKLNSKELREINGGSDNSASTGTGVGVGADALISIDYQWTQGDKSYSSKTEIGKDVNADFNLLNLNKG